MQLKWAVIKYIPASLSLIRIRCSSLSCFVHFHWSLCMSLSPLLALDFCYIILLLATWAAPGWISGFCLYNGLLDLWLHLKYLFSVLWVCIPDNTQPKVHLFMTTKHSSFVTMKSFTMYHWLQTGCLLKADLRFTMTKSKEDPLWTAWKYTLQ